MCFQMLAKLGEGSYGAVFKALDKRDGRFVAIKILEVENEDTAELTREINILRQCKSDFVVGYKGSYEKDSKVWIVMEYFDAGSLCDLMTICDKTLTEQQIAIVMKMALQGLDYLHKIKKIHRDIKAGNILLNLEGDCKLADFGVSAELVTTMAKRKTVIGTPYWMAPEVLQSQEYDGKADIWSLAITAIEMAVGEPPHSHIHPMRAIFLIPSSPPPTLSHPEMYSQEFKEFLASCLHKVPARRPTAADLLEHSPFIRNAGPKSVIAELVEECMAEIEQCRADEDNNNGEDRSGSSDSSDNDEGGGTLVNPASRGGKSGTLVPEDALPALPQPAKHISPPLVAAPGSNNSNSPPASTPPSVRSIGNSSSSSSNSSVSANGGGMAMSTSAVPETKKRIDDGKKAEPILPPPAGRPAGVLPLPPKPLSPSPGNPIKSNSPNIPNTSIAPPVRAHYLYRDEVKLDWGEVCTREENGTHKMREKTNKQTNF
jgi:serine/threonine kinase 3